MVIAQKVGGSMSVAFEFLHEHVVSRLPGTCLMLGATSSFPTVLIVFLCTLWVGVLSWIQAGGDTQTWPEGYGWWALIGGRHEAVFIGRPRSWANTSASNTDEYTIAINMMFCF